jgi:nucleotide-binding universal stress UspA family protein
VVCLLSKLEKLLLATDRSVFSERAVEKAINFAKLCSSRLYVLAVLKSNSEYVTIGADSLQKEEEEALQYLEFIKNRMRQEGVSGETILRESDDTSRIIVE